MGSHLPFQDAWTRARNRYTEDLTHEEKQWYLEASPELIFYDASAAEKRHGAGSTSRGLMDKLQPFVTAIELYGQALDVYSNAYPLALSPLWGSIRVILLEIEIAREFGKYFEKLVDMFARIGDILPRFHVYEKLFPNHERLTHALSVAYVDVIVFCSDAKAVFRRGQRASLTNLKVGFKLIWKPFESQFGQQLHTFRIHTKNVEKEADLSHMVEAADARALVLADHLQLEKTKKENEYRRIFAMISSIDVEAKHRKFQSLRFHGTGEWLLQNDKYLEWKHASSPSSLCCYGIPGCGKSVLASRIIDDLSSTATASQVTIVYYYCDYADQRTLQTDRILGTILKQLIPEDRIPEEIEPLILQTYKDGQRYPETHELVELVCSLLQLRPLVYIILDGLDECERQPRQEIVSFLDRLLTLEKTLVRTFLSCRDEDQLLRLLKSYSRIQLTAAALGNDIKSFVEGSVRSRIKSGQLTLRNSDLEHRIVRELVNKSHGMFLWVFFQLDDLCEALSDAMIQQTLQNLPVGLVETYERILLKISKSPLAKQDIASRAFNWILCARRPMKADEVQEAVAFEISDKFWDRDKIPDENLMIETCRGLLIRDEVDRTVRFAHHTVQQYLLSAPVIGTQEGARFPISPRSEAEAFVGQVCVTYLCFHDFETQITRRTPNVHPEDLGVLRVGGPARIPTVLGIGKSLLQIPYRLLGGTSTTTPLNIDYSKYLARDTRTRPQAPSDLTKKYRLLEYIVEHWIEHIKDLELALGSKLRHLVLHKTLSFEFRPWGQNQHFGPYGCHSCPDLTKAKDLPFMSLFHYAAQAGYWNLMESFVPDYCQHEVPSDVTLLIACRNGQDLIVSNLMRRFEFDISDGQAIYLAVAAGHADVLTHLMDLGQKSTEDGKKSPSYNSFAKAPSLLHLAAKNGHEKVVDVILDRMSGSDSLHLNEMDEGNGRTVFSSAVMSGNTNMVRNLLARGAAIKIAGTTAIHIAAECGHQETMRMLLDFATNDFNSGIDNEDGAKESYARILLGSADAEGDFPIHKAARNGHGAVVELILEYHPQAVFLRMDLKGRPKNSEVAHGYTALHLAARGGHLNVLGVLLEKGADIKATTHQSKLSALHLAAAEGHEEVVQLLLQHDPNPYTETFYSISPLEHAVRRGHHGIVRALVKDGHREGKLSNFDPATMAYWIDIAARDGFDAILHILLEELAGHSEKGYAERVLEVAKYPEYKNAIPVLTNLLEERQWES